MLRVFSLVDPSGTCPDSLTHAGFPWKGKMVIYEGGCGYCYEIGNKNGDGDDGAGVLGATPHCVGARMATQMPLLGGSAMCALARVRHRPLVGRDLLDWIVLRRVSNGTVTRFVRVWCYRGRKMGDHLVPVLEWLLADGLIMFVSDDPAGQQRVLLTDTGCARFSELDQRRSVLRHAV